MTQSIKQVKVKSTNTAGFSTCFRHLLHKRHLEELIQEIILCFFRVLFKNKRQTSCTKWLPSFIHGQGHITTSPHLNDPVTYLLSHLFIVTKLAVREYRSEEHT